MRYVGWRHLGVAAASVIATPVWADDNALDRQTEAAKAAVLAQPAEAIRYTEIGERLAVRLNTASARARSLATLYRLRAEAYTQLGQLKISAPLLREALQLVNQYPGDSKTLGEILLSVGNYQSAISRLSDAFDSYEKAHKAFLTAGDRRGQALSLVYISSLYGDANDYRSALKYIDEADVLRVEDPQLRTAINMNRAAILREMGRYREAEAAYVRSYDLASRQAVPALQARIKISIARLRLKIGDIRGARSLLTEASALSSRNKQDRLTLQPQLLEVAAQTELQEGDLVGARNDIVARFGDVDPATTTLAFREAHQTAYETYRALGDDRSALIHLAALKRLDDQATKLATSANSALAAARFDFTNQELRLATLQRDDANRRVAYARQRASTERAIFVGVVLATAIIIALLGVWLWSLSRARARESAAASDLAATNDALGKALAAKTAFLATTSHEIRTPLNGILGMTQVMLADRGMPADARDRLSVVHGAGLTMRALVDDILDVAKMETGNVTIDCAPFDLRATLAEAGRLWAEQARAKGVAFAFKLNDSPGWVAGDAARVRQIAFNLLSNALKFTERGSVTLCADRRGETYRIRVNDTGIGIPDSQIGHIFESFRQADSSTTRRFGGTGLGLTICRNLAHAMNGTITVESKVGQGTTFTVTLPLMTACPSDDQEDRPSGASRVIVVDASPISRATLRTLIARRRPDPIAVASVLEASDLAAGAELIVVDQNAAGDVATIVQLAAIAPVALLWRGEAPIEVARIVKVIAKPIDAAALAATLFDETVQPSLVREVA